MATFLVPTCRSKKIELGRTCKKTPGWPNSRGEVNVKTEHKK